MNPTSYEPTEYLYDVIASRDRYIVQVELELHRLKAILIRRDQQIKELTDATASSTATTTATVTTSTIETATTTTAATAFTTPVEDFFSAPIQENTSCSETTEVEEVGTKSRRPKRKISDYLVDGDVVKHTETGLTLIYSGETFVTEDGTLYNSLNDISTKLTAKRLRPNGWDACKVRRGDNTWITISKLEKHTA
jgi:hypothetical protein